MQGVFRSARVGRGFVTVLLLLLAPLPGLFALARPGQTLSVHANPSDSFEQLRFLGSRQTREEPKQIFLTFAGDIMAHTPNFTKGPYDAIYHDIRFILDASDLSFGNLETPVSEKLPYSTYPTFNIHRDYAWAAIKAGFNVFSLANNHAADQGRAGISATLESMTVLAGKSRAELGRDLYYSGLNPSGTLDSFRLLTIVKNGMKIGYVSIAEGENNPYFNPWVQVVHYTNTAHAKAFLDWLKSVRPQVDLLVLSYHWGVEYSRTLDEARKSFAVQLVNAGVDILWGNHPHVLQPWYTLQSPRGQALVLPSMGNFVSGQVWDIGPGDSNSGTAFKGDSALFRVEAEVDRDNGISFPVLDPILTSNFKELGRMIVKPTIDLVRGLTGPWKSYYEARLLRMSADYPGSFGPSVFPDRSVAAGPGSMAAPEKP